MYKIKYLVAIAVLILTVAIGHAQTTQHADSLHQRGRDLVNEGKIVEGREHTRQAMEIRKLLLGEVSEDYITSLNNYAFSFAAEENYRMAMELQEQVMALCKKLPTPHPNIGMYATNMGRYYYMNDDEKNAAKMWEQALPLVEKHGEIYEYLLNGLGVIYDDLGDRRGTNHVMALMEEHNQHELSKPCDEPKCMLERARYYGVSGNRAKAKECYLKALSMPMDDELKVQVHEAYASYLGGILRDNASAADYYLSAANITKSIGGDTEVYADLMYKAGVCAFLGRKYEESVSAYQATIDFYKQYDSEAAKKKIALCMKGMGNAYNGMRDHAKARDCFRDLVKYYEQCTPSSAEYPQAILRLAKAEKFNKEYMISIEHHKQAMAIFAERGMESDYADAVTSLQLCYAYAGIDETVDGREEETLDAQMEKIDKIIHQELEDLELTRTYLGKLTYARSLATLGDCYEMKQDWENSVKFYQQYIEAVREAIRDEFRMQSEAERMLVWGEEKKEMSRMLELLIELPEGYESEMRLMAGIAYDAELLSKGILLNSSIEFGKILAAKGDAKLQDAYEQTKMNEVEIDRMRKNAATDDDLDMILKLMQQNQSLQLEIYRGCAEYADFTNYISYTWKDVQNALQPADVAIEFAFVGSGMFAGDTQLVALVLTRDMEMPQVIKVCDIDVVNFIAEMGDDIYNKADIGNIVWGGLRQYFADKDRLFFSADGVLNRIAIEYLQYDDSPLSEQYEVYRLSSTKELCFKRESARPTRAALFGDINYNDEATNSESTLRSLASLRGSGDVGGFADLSNTLREINEIRGILESKGADKVEIFRDTEASKSAFMDLSDTKVDLLHIATHGMYKDEKIASDSESMQNSLLVFAGANMDENALVTAADIATMNLRQCDFAVLSACETGLGKLGGDGVFGLQRGFKNAGVHTLLMSLKNVYDDSTAELMIRFYEYLMNGKTKREALVNAQHDLRANGYMDPKYWATFILLDAL